MNEIAAGQIRHIAGIVGAVLVTLGYTDTATVNADVNLLIQVVGGIMAIAASVGSVINKVQHKAALQAAANGGTK